MQQIPTRSMFLLTVLTMCLLLPPSVNAVSIEWGEW